MKNIDLNTEELSISEMQSVNGGNLAKDAGYVIGYSVRWNYEFVKGWVNYIFD